MRLTIAGFAARLGLAASLTVLLAGSAAAQGVSARVEGAVTDESGAPVPGVSVTATNQATSAAKSATTDATGHYALTPLATGVYKVSVELSGFKTKAAEAAL